MWLISKSVLEKKFRHLHHNLKHSFSSVKKDTTNIHQWLAYLNKKSQQQEDLIRQLHSELSSMPKSRQDIHRILEDYYSHESIFRRVKELEEKVDEVAKKQSLPPPQPSQELPKTESQQAPQLQESLHEIKRKVERLESKKESMKERIIKRITKNSKDYVKGIILSYIRKYERMPALRLKEMIVEDQRLCSKSSFYRIMEEVEQAEDVEVVRKGREKHYFVRATHQLE